MSKAKRRRKELERLKQKVRDTDSRRMGDGMSFDQYYKLSQNERVYEKMIRRLERKT